MVSGLSAEEQAAVVARNGGIEKSAIPALRLHVVEVSASALNTVLSSYQSDLQVERAEINQTRKSEGTPSDPSYIDQWYLPRISWDQVYDQSLVTLGTVTVAILDTGIDATHPDLNSAVVPGTSILNGSDGMTDPNGHGTWLAGIIAAVPNNIGIAGIGFTGVRVMPVVVLGDTGTGLDSDIIAGVMYAVDHGASVILMGFSNSGFSQGLQDAIDYAWSNNVVLVAATGNDGSSTPTYPAGDRGVVGVSATDTLDNIATFSNYGVDTFLAAPGTNILTIGINNSYPYVNGTSASAAIVSGVAAIMKAKDPSLSNGVIVGRLARTADPAGTLDQTGNGRVNMARAVSDTGTDFIQPAGAPIGGPIVGPYVIGAASDGEGTLVVSPNTVSTGSSGNTLAFTFNSGSGYFKSGSQLSLKVPSGWTPPTTGNIVVQNIDCTVAALNSISGSGPWTILVDMECTTPKRFTITYSPVTAPSTGSQVTFTTATKAGSSGTFVDLILGSPVVTVNNPVPAATSISPASAIYGGAGFTLTVNGSNFVPNSTVQFNGSNRTTTYISSTQLTATIPAGDLTAVGTFNITVFNPAPAGGTSNVQTFTVNPVALTITANNRTKTYGQTVTFAGTEFTASGLVNGDTVSSVTLASTGSGAGAVLGTYAIVPSAAAFGAGSAGNYTISYVNGTLTVNPATLTITADNRTKSYGQTVTFAGTEFTASGLANGDAVSSVTLASTGAGAGAVVGTYAIIPSAAVFGAGSAANYTISYSNGTLTVNKATLTVTANNAGRTYGSANPAFTVSYSGFVNGETAAVLSGAPSLATTATAASPVGSYTITASAGTLSAANYIFMFVNGTLSINPVPLTVRANDATKSVGQTVTFAGNEFAASGLVNGDTVTSVTLSSAGADASATAGTYSIVPSAAVFGTGSATNYTINYASGTLTVNNKITPTVYTWPSASGITYGQSLSSSTLLGGNASIPGSFAFTTPSTAPNAGSYSASVTFTPTDTVNYNTVSGSVNVTVAKAIPTVTTWPTASGITYGQSLSSSALTGGSASVPGSFSFTTPSATPNAGTYSAAVTFTPTDAANYNTVSGGSASVAVAKATPTVTTWPSASGITYGQSLSSSTLTGGSASVPGSFFFTTPSTIPNAGTYSAPVTFTPTDTVNYNTVSGSVNVTVAKMDPGVTAWPTASGIIYGQSLSASTLMGGNASVPGSFAFTTPSTAPNAGPYSAPVTFTPTDTTNYASVSGSVSVAVAKATPTVTTLPVAGGITYGQSLSSSALTGGSASVPGSFAFTTPSATPNAGAYSAAVTFTPTDTANYNTVSGGSVNVAVAKATPVITWNNPANIAYGTALGGTQLNATASPAAGTYAFTPPAGMVLNAGNGQTLSVTFTPTDTANYNSALKTVTINVIKAGLTIRADNTSKTVGQTVTFTGTEFTATGLVNGDTVTSVTLSSAGTDASAPVGTYSITPSAATGTGLSNYTINYVPGTLTVNDKVTPTITWSNPAAITYGTALSGTQLNASASVTGTFTYVPAAGSVLNAGSGQTLSVTFTPDDTAHYNTASKNVTINVLKANAAVTLGGLSQVYDGTAKNATAATNPTGLAVTFTYNGTSTAPANAGSYTVVGTVSDTNYQGSATGTMIITKATPVVTAWPVASGITYGQQLSASTLTGGSATVPGGFAFTTPGTGPNAGSYSAPVTFTPADTTNYNSVSSMVNVAVAKADQAALTINAPASLTYGITAALTTGGGSGTGAVSYSTGATAGCSVSGSTLSVTNASGTCSVSAIKAADANYNEVTSAPAAVSLQKANQATLTVNAPSTLTYGSTATLTASGGSGTGAVSYSAGSSTGCSVSGGTLSATDASGTCSVTATKAADTNYNEATSSPATVVLKKAAPDVTAWPTASGITYGQTLASSTLSGGSASVPGGFAFTTPSTTPNAGIYSAAVTFTPTDTTNYNTVSGSVNVAVARADQATLTINAPSTLTYGSPATLTASGGSGTGAVSYSAGLSTGCTVSAGTLSVTDASGTCSVTATKAEDANHNAVTSSAATVALQKANQTITFGALPGKAVGDADFAPGATASSGLAVSYESSNPAVATIAGGKIHVGLAGTTTVTAYQAGNTNYHAAASVQQNLTVNAGGQTIAVTQHAPATARYNSAFTVSATASSGLPVTITASGQCSGSGSGQAAIAVTSASGTCTVAYNQAGDVNYLAAAQVTETVSARKASQTITFGALPGKMVGEADFAPGATASSGLEVTYASSFTTVATIVDGKIHVVGPGTTTIIAYQAGDANYDAAAAAQQSLTVSSPSPFIGGGTGGRGFSPWITWSGDLSRDNTINFYEHSLCPAGAVCSYNWNFGDPASGPANTATGTAVFHTFSRSGAFTVLLTASDGSTSKTCAIEIFVNTKPMVSHGPVTTDLYTISFTDISLSTDGIDLPPNAVTVNWGDGTVSTQNAGSVFTHTYTRARTYTILHTVIDAGDANGWGKLIATEKITVSVPQKFTVSGTVTRGGLGLAGVTISLKYNGHTKATTKTDASGSYSFKNIPAGVYTMRAYKHRTTFSGLPDSLTVNAGTTVDFTAL